MRVGDLIGRIKGSLAVPATSPDDLAGADGRRLLDAYLAEVKRKGRYYVGSPRDLAAGKRILESDAATQLRVLHAGFDALEAITSRSRGPDWQLLFSITPLLRQIGRRKLPFSDDGLLAIVRAMDAGKLRDAASANWLPYSAILKAVEERAAGGRLDANLRRALERMRPTAGVWDYLAADDRRLIERIDRILGVSRPEVLERGEPFADAALEYLRTSEPEPAAAWSELLTFARSATASKPSVKWLSQSKQKVEAVGGPDFSAQVKNWFGLIGSRRDEPLSDLNSEVLKGLVWCCILSEDAELCRAVADCAESAFRKIPGIGPRSAKVGNACIYALGAMAATESVAQLARLRLRVKYHPAQELIAAALESAAAKAGVTADELEEMVTPTFGLREGGLLQVQAGEYRAEACMAGMQLSEWTWVGPDGTRRKSIPAVLKQTQPDVLKALKRQREEIEKMLPAQRDRIERLLITDRPIPVPALLERYLDHPLVSGLARRLIWHFRRDDCSGTGIRQDERIVGSDGVPLEWIDQRTEARLWHPLGFAPEYVLGWRCFLEEHEITQPFKQAHREIYLLTEAELATGTYSNRFAGHILKQHQLNALCRNRGWRCRLQGGFDSGGDVYPTLLISDPPMRAEFWVDFSGDESMSDAGIYLYVSSDQVRFTGPDNQAIPLTEVPARIFSEVMRDVDLFVGVSSVGADPNWRDGGEQGHRAYWEHFAFGDLNASAHTRRDVLERLLPRLKIRDRARLAGKYLVVRGDLRTYRIHLGSANILMEPNDQYLCIVQDRGSRPSEGVFLPFEGDHTLAVILSKAFMLADDRKIKDPTILRQLERQER